MSFDVTTRILQELKDLARSMAISPRGMQQSPGVGGVTDENASVGASRRPQVKGAAASSHNKDHSAAVHHHKDPLANTETTALRNTQQQQQHADSATCSVSQRTATIAPLDQSDIASRSQTPVTPMDMDGSTFDGVKTLVLFLNSDQERFEQVTRSMWAPEEADEAVGDDEEDVENWVRVPAFPFGGAVTDAQERLLYRKYCEVRLASHSPNHRRGMRPYRVTADAFCQRAFPQAVEGSGVNLWKAHSPHDFVVEVEPEVLFDAHSAKADRRLKLYEALAANPSDATMASVVNLRVIMDPLKTGFEEDKEYNIEPGQVVANRFQIVDLLGKATFSRAVRAYDLHQPVHDDAGVLMGYVEVCLKIINNSKEFFDQSLDEIRLLQLINAKSDPDDVHVVRLIDFFYFKEHTFLVTELLSDNLYEYAKYNRENEEEFYFTLPKLRSIARQVTEALAYIHSLNLMHCDLKPENILFVSHRRCIVKVIDFGSSCFLSDHLSSYIQSRSYRAPEVILGADYDGRIDVWSLGAILAELVTGDVLFSSETVPEMLARIVAICGKPLPRGMLWEGRHTHDFLNKFGCIYEVGNKERDENAEDSFYLYTPIPLEVAADGTPLSDKDLPYAMLRAKLAASGMEDEQFISFLEQCLTLDHKVRPTAAELLKHPFLSNGDIDNGGEEEEVDTPEEESICDEEDEVEGSAPSGCD